MTDYNKKAHDLMVRQRAFMVTIVINFASIVLNTYCGLHNTPIHTPLGCTTLTFTILGVVALISAVVYALKADNL